MLAFILLIKKNNLILNTIVTDTLLLFFEARNKIFQMYIEMIITRILYMHYVDLSIYTYICVSIQGWIQVISVCFV